MSILGTLFGGAGAGKEIVAQVGGALDEMFYSNQEVAEDAAQARREGYAAFMEWMKSTSGSRIARRIIALTVTGVWATLFVTSTIMRIAAVFTDDVGTLTSAKFIEVSVLCSSDAKELAPLVGIVLLFYFGGPAAIDGVKGLVMKWSGGTK